ncbi:hypothetical protein PAUR_a0893 [Pseudoalteromonas aurantia 208]|uniref:Uncharacterized protein n=1 Tax=Pseudoalteromonas aurantia 208 TaxID=1314867 RepID=A0ABR9E959_9GAMM|nr:hypothetical protein [Pseudoalteromonas aurantia 208]
MKLGYIEIDTPTRDDTAKYRKITKSVNPSMVVRVLVWRNVVVFIKNIRNSGQSDYTST